MVLVKCIFRAVAAAAARSREGWKEEGRWVDSSAKGYVRETLLSCSWQMQSVNKC